MEQQRIREALNLDVFFQSLLQLTASTESDDEDEEDGLMNEDLPMQRRVPPFCYAKVDKSRHWIKDVLLEDSSESEDEDINDILKFHQATLRYRDQYFSDPLLNKYMYYSSDLLTGKNKWPAHYQAVKKKCLKRKTMINKQVKPRRNLTQPHDLTSSTTKALPNLNGKPQGEGAAVKKRALSLSRKRSTSIAALRRHVWKAIAKKEIPKAYRQHIQTQASKIALLKKASKDATKRVRAKAHDSRFRAKKEVVIGRARRMTREAQLFWKKYVRVEKSQRKHAEKQALAQRRIDDELREAQKQQQKLKFLITQTELYAHFVGGNMTASQQEEPFGAETDLVEDRTKDEILSHLDTTSDGFNLSDNEYNRERALDNANAAFERHQSKMDMFSNAERLFKEKESKSNETFEQPKLLQGQLTGYQLVGVNWIFNLYLHGLNGILADDMGLGKTVQTIAFLAGLAERYDVWGPFLVIAPASTLNNWHQEFSRFLPAFKILPYWGSTSERKVLRLFWNQKSEVKPHSSAPFHVLITSYQLATTDVRYFQRIQWHYIVFDEAHALKSSSSIRWRTLLEFNCRNRLLLTGTPIQNTMAELWALLHFIMPTLFDNHAEFNDWFSKNIENYVESKSSIDQSDLSRLHMVLKPFILRRLKCDVEHELTEKVEVRVLCQLSPRQRALYNALQKNILIKDLLRSQGASSHSTNNIVLMNLVMQFRKVCNHPDIFHSRDISSPYCLQMLPYHLPRLIYDTFFSPTSTRRNKVKFFYSDLNVHAPSNVQKSLMQANQQASSFSFLIFLNLSVGQYWKFWSGSIMDWYQQLLKLKEERRRHFHFSLFRNTHSMNFHLRTRQPLIHHHHLDKSGFLEENHRLEKIIPTFLDLHAYSSRQLSVMTPLLFVGHLSSIFGHFNQTITCVAESRNLATCTIKSADEAPALNDVMLSTFSNKKPSQVGSNKRRVVVSVRANEATEIPSVIQNLFFSKAFVKSRDVYCNDLSALHDFQRTSHDTKNFLRFDDSLPSSAPIVVPDRERLVTDSGKLQALDMLLRRLKDGGHRVLIYSQMTKMIDILEEYMLMRRHMYVRLDGSCRISSRRDTVAGFQSCDNIFVFLLSTRAGGLGINLTAADTVIFYDSDWNPTVDQQAMDRAHRLGQTKQVTVYRLVCKGTVDERMLARAEAKSAIQRMVIQDGYFKSDALNQKEMVSLLLDDNQITNAAQKDTDLQSSLEKGTGKRKYRRNPEKEGKARKKVKKLASVESNISAAELEALKLNPQVINISSKSLLESADPDAVTSSTNVNETKSNSGDEQLIVVDDSSSSPTSAESAVVRGRRKRGRPRIRPFVESSRSRLLSRAPIQRRWSGISRRGRGARGPRRGRSFSGRAAAMAGERAGALAASSAASLHSHDNSSK